MEKKISTQLADYEFDRSGILHIRPKAVQFTDELIAENLEVVIFFIGNKKVFMYVDNSLAMPFDKSHRLAFEEQCDQFCLAVAFTSNSVLGNAIANIYIAMTRTKIPMKIFRKKDEAMNWLQQLMNIEVN
jgi:hypothetical protein